MNQSNQLQTGPDLEKAFNEWNELIFKYIVTRLQNVELAEDMTQEVFVKAWRSKDSFDETKSSLKNWLFVIATNTMRDYFRKKKIETDEIDENITQESDISAETEQNDLISYVFEKIKLLPERDQELLALRYKSDLKIEEVAEIMEMEDSAVKVAIHRAIKKLQSICNDEM